MRHKFYALMMTIGCVCALLPAIAGPAASGDDSSKPFDEYKIKAVFIYNFSKFVEWPGEQALAKTHAATVCVLGDNPFGGKLDILKQASSAALTFAIKRDISQSEIPSCQILFISKSESGNISSILADAHNYPVLTVSDVEGFAEKGGNIEMMKSVNNIGKESIKLTVNLRSAEEERLRIDAQLLGIAAEVIK